MALPAEKPLGHRWGAWITVKWKPGSPENAWEGWKGAKEIKEGWSTTGEWDCALWVEIDDPNQIEKLVWEKIRSNKWVEKTETRWAKKWL